MLDPLSSRTGVGGKGIYSFRVPDTLVLLVMRCYVQSVSHSPLIVTRVSAEQITEIGTYR